LRDCRNMTDFSLAFRTIVRRPAAAVIAVLLLAFSIGTVTIVFSALNAVVLRPLEVPNPEELVQFSILVIANPKNPVTTFDATAYESVRGHSEALSAVFARSERTESIDDGEGSPITLDLVTGNYFTELGIRAHLGRTLVADDDREDSNGAMPAVLSD